MTNVMDGIRILEVAEHTFVPAASAILADWGAEVIKIEHVERGDAMRGLMSTGLAGLGGSVHVLLEHANRGKKSLGLDLADPAGLDVLYQLAARCDVFLTNKMPGVRERLHIDVDDIRAHNPDIVYVKGTGYGSHGPEADAGGYDFLGFWARAGCGDAATPPDIDGLVVQPAPGYGDSIGAMTIAGGIAAALLRRERTGEAHVVDVSLLGTGMWAMGGAIALSQLNGTRWGSPPASGRGGAPNNPLVGTYRTADNRFLAFSMLQGFHYWPEVCNRIGRDDLVDDARFDSVEKLMENTPAAVDVLADVIGAHTLAEWKERFAGMKGQWAVAQNTLELRDDPQVQANGYLQDVESEDGVPFRLVATPVQFDGATSPTRRAPQFNEHGDAILAEELGLDWDTIVDLKVKGIVA
jgi:crotonobetainyl-CoA:carnitine CoA-transferase CaiB-like acyl-CoA transferase